VAIAIARDLTYSIHHSGVVYYSLQCRAQEFYCWLVTVKTGKHPVRVSGESTRAEQLRRTTPATCGTVPPLQCVQGGQCSDHRVVFLCRALRHCCPPTVAHARPPSPPQQPAVPTRCAPLPLRVHGIERPFALPGTGHPGGAEEQEQHPRTLLGSAALLRAACLESKRGEEARACGGEAPPHEGAARGVPAPPVRRRCARAIQRRTRGSRPRPFPVCALSPRALCCMIGHWCRGMAPVHAQPIRLCLRCLGSGVGLQRLCIGG
jgi:hypothetical protein